MLSAGVVFDRPICRLSANGSEFLRNAAGSVGPARGRVGDAKKPVFGFGFKKSPYIPVEMELPLELLLWVSGDGGW